MPVPIYILPLSPPLSEIDISAPEPFRANLADWRRLGLGSIVDRVRGNGTVIRQDDGRYRLIVWPEQEEFSPAVPETLIEIDESLTVGWPGAVAPGPEDIDNGNPLQLQTCGVVLADNNVWQVPEIRDPTGSKLPTDLVKDRRSRTLLTPIKREYLQLWEESNYWFGLLLQSEGSFSLERALDYATVILGLRYRFCDATQSALRVIDSTNVLEIVKASLSWHSVLAFAAELVAEDDKKKVVTAESTSGDSGPLDSGHTTGQPAVSSGSQSNS